MSSFKKEVENTRRFLASARSLTAINDVVYFRPPIKIKLKKSNRNKTISQYTSDYKTKTFDKLDYDRKQSIQFICRHRECEHNIITVFKVINDILPENVYFFSGDERRIPHYINEIFLEKQKANILRVLYADNYEIIFKFNPEKLDILKEEVDEYFEEQLKLEKKEEEKKRQEQEKWEKRELEKTEREKRKSSWKYQLGKLLDDFGGVSPSSPSPSKTRSKGGKKKGTRKRYAYTRRAHKT